MDIEPICIVTENVASLRDFYSHTLEIPCDNLSPNPAYIEFDFGGVRTGKLAIFNFEYAKEMMGDLSESLKTTQVWLEFKVDNIDAEYERLKALGVTFLEEPTIQAWGNKYFNFCDPDGNPISFYQPYYVKQSG